MTAARGLLARGSAILVAAVLVCPLLAACTHIPYGYLDNRTGMDVVVLSQRQEALGTVPAGETGMFKVGGPRDCLPEFLVFAPDHGLVGRILGPVCEHGRVVVEKEQLSAAATFVVRNATGFEFSEGEVGSIAVAALGFDEELAAPLAAPTGGCARTWVNFLARDVDGTAVRSAGLPYGSLVCDRDVVVLEPGDVEMFDGLEWRPFFPSRRDTPGETATVRMTNNTDVNVVAWFDVAESALLVPAETRFLPLGVAVGECTNLRHSTEVSGSQRLFQNEYTEICDGDTAIVTTDGITVFGPDGTPRPT